MRKILLLLALLMLTVGPVWAQNELAPSTGDGPQLIKPEPPKPDKDGVYRIGPGITSPELVHPATATYPPSAWKTGHPGIVVISAVIGIDGVAKIRGVVNPIGSPFEDPAMDAVKQSQFHPGLASGSPVPVLVCLGVPFLHVKAAVPWLQPCPQTLDPLPSGQPDPFEPPPGAKPPVPINTPEAEFPEEARRKKIQGVVIVSMIVNEKGMPTDIRLVKSVGYGLDENAIEAAGEYRFKPATVDGKPIAVRLTIEINFRLYHRRLF